MKEPLLSLNDLEVSFFNNSGEIKVVRRVSFNLEKGEVNIVLHIFRGSKSHKEY